MALSEFDSRLLDFAERAPRSPDVRAEAVRRELGIPPARYHQRLNMLIDDPDARSQHPVLLARLDRIRRAGDDAGLTDN